jgi:RNA polymerase sigma-70 factor (ECF subfamily)
MGEKEVEDLLRRAATGDRQAAGDLARRYEVRVKELIHRRLGPDVRARVDTDDLYQSTITTALDDLSGFHYEGEKALIGWLYAIAERRILMAVRRHRAAKRDLRREQVLHDPDEIPGARTSPSRAAVRGEMTRGLRNAMAQLEEPERSVVRLHSFEGLGFADVAERLGLPGKSSARHVFQRALKRMGELLEPD